MNLEKGLSDKRESIERFWLRSQMKPGGGPVAWEHLPLGQPNLANIL